MIPTIVTMILNILIIVLLAGTMFFAARLSLHLKDFRANRKSLEKLIADLSAQIIRAEGAIAGMKQAARESGRELQDHIGEAQALLDELQLMTHSGHNLAVRLESAASGRGGAALSPSPAPAAFTGRAPERKREPVRSEGPSFVIRDPELESAVGENGLFADEDDGDDGDASSLSSRAERELYEALKIRGRK